MSSPAREGYVPPDREIEVEIPDNDEADIDDLLELEPEAPATAAADGRESVRVQAKVARVGAEMGFLQPNMDIHLHIVAPVERREKALREIRRPVFSLLEQGPLCERCSFLSYGSINKLAETPRLVHTSDTIITECKETTERPGWPEPSRNAQNAVRAPHGIWQPGRGARKLYGRTPELETVSGRDRLLEPLCPRSSARGNRGTRPNTRRGA